MFEFGSTKSRLFWKNLNDPIFATIKSLLLREANLGSCDDRLMAASTYTCTKHKKFAELVPREVGARAERSISYALVRSKTSNFKEILYGNHGFQ